MFDPPGHKRRSKVPIKLELLRLIAESCIPYDMPTNAVKRSNKLQVVLHVKRVLKCSEENLEEHVFQVWRWAYRETLFREGDCWDLGRTNSPTSARHGDGLGYIRIWAIPLRRLVFLGWCPESLQLHPRPSTTPPPRSHPQPRAPTSAIYAMSPTTVAFFFTTPCTQAQPRDRPLPWIHYCISLTSLSVSL